MSGEDGRMSIALVVSASTGGIGRHVASLAERFVAAGHDVTVFAPEETIRAHALETTGARVEQPGALRGARQRDVVHAHGYKAGARAASVCRFGGPPLVVTWHNEILGRGVGNLTGRTMQRVVARSADLTLGASSDLVAKALSLGARSARLGPVAAPTLSIPDGFNSQPLRASIGINPDDLMILTVSRLAKQKNLDMLIDVAALLRHRKDLRFLVAGEGPLRDALGERIITTEVQVDLLGRRDDVADLLAASDLAVLTSTWEARALVAQEALLAGVPLVSTRVGGIEELVGEAAVLVDSGDAAAAAEALEWLADDPAARQALIENGKARAATWPDEDAVAADVLCAYADVMLATPVGRDSPGR